MKLIYHGVKKKKHQSQFILQTLFSFVSKKFIRYHKDKKEVNNIILAFGGGCIWMIG